MHSSGLPRAVVILSCRTLSCGGHMSKATHRPAPFIQGAIAIICALAAAIMPTERAFAGEALERIQKAGVIRSPDPGIWPPGSFRDASGELTGFDVEVLREIARRLGVTVEYVAAADGALYTWEEQTSGQWHGAYDIVVNSMTPTA